MKQPLFLFLNDITKDFFSFPLWKRINPVVHAKISLAHSVETYQYSVLVFLVVILTGISMVYVGAHYRGDTGVATMIGILTAVLVHRHSDNWFYEKSEPLQNKVIAKVNKI